MVMFSRALVFTDACGYSYTVEDSYVAVGDDAVAIMSGPDYLNGACQSDASTPCPVSPISQVLSSYILHLFQDVFMPIVSHNCSVSES